MPSVATIMTRDPVFVRCTTPLVECAALFSSWGVRHLPVIGLDSSLTGMLYDYEVFGRGQLHGSRYWVPFDDRDQWLRAGDVAGPAEIVAGAEDDADKVLRDLAEVFSDAATIVDQERRPVGILTEHDAVRIGSVVLDDELSTADLPRRPLIAVDRGDRAVDARALMVRHRIRHVPVLSGEALYGILSYRDLALAGVLEPTTLAEDMVRRLPPIFRGAHLPITDAASIMAAHVIGCLVIADPAMRPVKLVTRTDLIYQVIQRFQQAAEA